MGLIDTAQLNYWQPHKPPVKHEVMPKTAQHHNPITQHLSYDMFWMLSIFGGILALDHLYLRSPLTFLAKLVVNILAFGAWWLYDCTQATFNKDVVKMYGLGVPSQGPKGIGAGVMVEEKPDEKHMNFFKYSIGLILGGLFGLDSFILGNNSIGFVRLVCLITGILAPISIFWYIANLIKFFFRTDTLINENWQFFGVQEPLNYKDLLKKSFMEKIPIISSIINVIKAIFSKIFGEASSLAKTAVNTVEAPFEYVKDKAGNVIEGAINTVEAPFEYVKDKAGNIIESAETTVEAPFKYIKDKAGNLIQSAETTVEAPFKYVEGKAESIPEKLMSSFKLLLSPLSLLFGGLTTAVESATQPIATAAESVAESAKVAATAVSTAAEAGKDAIDGTVTVAKDTIETLSELQTLGTAAEGALQASMKGGANTFLPLLILSTIGVIIVSGLVVSYHRFRQNGQRNGKILNDAPPQPRDVRKDDKQRPNS
jgi:hypothetical protein